MVQKSRVTRGGGEKNKEPSSQIRRGGRQRGRERREIETRSWGKEPSEIVMEARDEDEGEGVRVREMGRGETARCQARGCPSH